MTAATEERFAVTSGCPCSTSVTENYTIIWIDMDDEDWEHATRDHNLLTDPPRPDSCARCLGWIDPEADAGFCPPCQVELRILNKT